MKLQDWRNKRNAVEELTLQSGLVVTCRRVALLDLAANGQIPTPLLGMVEQFANSSTGTVKINVHELPQITELVNLVVQTVVVAPAIAAEPSETHLGINELSFAERMVIFGWANGPATQLAPFPGESAGSLPAA